MIKRTFLVGSIVVLSVIVFWLFTKYSIKTSKTLVSPETEQAVNEQTPQPSTFSYNPPKEVKYDSSTNLKQVLETVNPQVLDSDFANL